MTTGTGPHPGQLRAPFGSVSPPGPAHRWSLPGAVAVVLATMIGGVLLVGALVAIAAVAVAMAVVGLAVVAARAAVHAVAPPTRRDRVSTRGAHPTEVIDASATVVRDRPAAPGR